MQIIQHDSLITDQTGGAIDRTGIAPLCFQVGLGSGDEEGAGVFEPRQPLEIDVTAIHDIESAGSSSNWSRILTSCILPSLMKMKEGILPRRSSNVWSLTAALLERNGAHGNTERHRSMVVESSA